MSIYAGEDIDSGFVFFFQAEDGIRDLVRSRGLGDVYKRQDGFVAFGVARRIGSGRSDVTIIADPAAFAPLQSLSLIHI